MNKKLLEVLEVFKDSEFTEIVMDSDGCRLEVLINGTFFVIEFDDNYRIVKYNYYLDYENTEVIYRIMYRDSLNDITVTEGSLVNHEFIKLLNNPYVTIEAWEFELIDRTEFIDILQEKLVELKLSSNHTDLVL